MIKWEISLDTILEASKGLKGHAKGGVQGLVGALVIVVYVHSYVFTRSEGEALHQDVREIRTDLGTLLTHQNQTKSEPLDSSHAGRHKRVEKATRDSANASPVVLCLSQKSSAPDEGLRKFWSEARQVQSCSRVSQKPSRESIFQD